jgi:hypothetical protein
MGGCPTWWSSVAPDPTTRLFGVLWAQADERGSVPLDVDSAAIQGGRGAGWPSPIGDGIVLLAGIQPDADARLSAIHESMTLLVVSSD